MREVQPVSNGRNHKMTTSSCLSPIPGADSVAWQQNMAGPAAEMKVAPKEDSTKLSLPQQYARVSLLFPAVFQACSRAESLELAEETPGR